MVAAAPSRGAFVYHWGQPGASVLSVVVLLGACTPAAPFGGADEAAVDAAVGPDASDSAVGAQVGVPTGLRAQVDPVPCEFTGVEADTWTYGWQLDGVDWSGVTLTTVHPGDTVFPGYTRPGQRWTCTARAWLNGVEVASASADADIVEVEEELDPLLPATAWVADGTVHYRGPLAASSKLKLTYGVDGWAPRSASAGAVLVLYDTQEQRAELTEPMVPDQGEWIAEVDVPEAARVVHMIFDDGATIDDAEGHEYTWDLEFPSVGPYLSWNDVATPTGGMVVNWVTGQPGLGVVEYGPDQENVAFAVGTVVDTIHHAALTGLPAGTTFAYRVRDGAGRASAWSTFRTAEVGEHTYSFLVASDMQDTGGSQERWPEVAAQMGATAPDARFVLIPGDLPADDHPGLWWLFFDGGRELFSHVPIVPAIGNHDDPGVPSSSDTTSWRYWFDLPATPGSEVYWRLDYGRTRIFAIDSEEAAQTAPGGVQYEWMRAETLDLWDGDTRGVDWALAAFHIPSYDAGERFASTSGTFRPLTEVFEGAIDAVISGHEHMYQRFLPLQYDGRLAPSGEYGLDPDDGTLYLVTPAAGFSFLESALVDADAEGGEQLGLLAWPEAPNEHASDEAHRSEDSIQGFLSAEVSPSDLSFAFIGMGNSVQPEPASVLDTVTLHH
ncbi:hypothetical protein LBMAG42_50240 [Deltaproteobacteria bacterium]|nr:hypothetical protein LBMAG42_50240 [Deltaproteobacteria bacterium]